MRKPTEQRRGMVRLCPNILQPILGRLEFSNPSALSKRTGLSWVTANKAINGMPIRYATAKTIAKATGFSVDELRGIAKLTNVYSPAVHQIAGHICGRCLAGHYEVDSPEKRVSMAPGDQEMAARANDAREVIEELTSNGEFPGLSDPSVIKDVIALLSQQKVICQGDDWVWRFTPHLRDLNQRRCASWRLVSEGMVKGLFSDPSGPLFDAVVTKVTIAAIHIDNCVGNDNLEAVVPIGLEVYRSIASYDPDLAWLTNSYLSGVQMLFDVYRARSCPEQTKRLTREITDITESVADYVIRPTNDSSKYLTEAIGSFIEIVEGLLKE